MTTDKLDFKTAIELLIDENIKETLINIIAQDVEPLCKSPIYEYENDQENIYSTTLKQYLLDITLDGSETPESLANSFDDANYGWDY